ncbi:MAG: hypothetical protein IPJ39_16200, partial [Saprospiraceae bacterium]|nr:hypothetical protein [Saprospiraceae bacterium]
LCSQGASNLESQFNSGSLSVWAHQFFSTSNTLSGKLFIKGRMPFDEALSYTSTKKPFDIYT